MKKILLILSVFLCSCSGIFNKTIKFTSTADKTLISPVTKAYFGGDYANFQRIEWDEGDGIRITSDYATTTDGNNYADYHVVDIKQVNEKSVGKLITIGAENLMWNDDYSGNYNFWSVYPISASSDFANVNFNGEFSANIPEDEFLMVAHSLVSYGKKEINLLYHPAFTTFRFSLISDIDNVILNSVKLSSNDYLVGDFTATIDGIINKTSEIEVNEGKKEITLETNVVLSKTDGSEFLFFCLPQNIGGVKITCNFDVNGETIEKSLGLYYLFGASKQYRFYLKLNTNKEIVFSDGLIEIVRCCSRIKYNNNEIRNMSHGQVKALLLTDETLQQDFIDFIENTTVLRSERTLEGNLSGTDFKAFKRLEKIEYIDVNIDSEIELLGLDIDFACFNHGIHYVIKDCQNLNSIKLLNVNNNNSIIEIDNCNNIENITTELVESTAIGCEFIISNMNLLKTFFIHNAKSISFNNCPMLESISMDNASRLESIYLKNTPVFVSGNFITIDKLVNINLENCGTNISDGLILMKGNGNAVNVSKINSNNITVRFVDNGGNTKIEF